jgi:hypothetical protein
MLRNLRYRDWDFSSTAEAVVGLLLILAIAAVAFV